MTALQMIGSLLAIPVGLASGYSIYHANFSAEARCQGLRGNIISMLDKSADATTLRMLVLRDVASFEASCESVDPDAVAAFKTLLASTKAPMPVRAVAPQTARAKPVALPTMPPPALAEAKPVKRQQTVSDAKWIAVVRHALVHATASSVETARAAPVRAPAPPPHFLGELRGPVRAPASVPGPALPPAASVAVTAAPAQASDHPVPPAAIPDNVPAQRVARSAEPEQRSGIVGLIDKIRLLGRVFGR
jgi:hypothetical protein